MIKIAFMASNRKIIKFNIDGGRVVYFDEMWKEGIQIYPRDSNLILRLKHSRKPNLQVMAALIIDANKGKDLEEYESCNGNEGEIANFIRKDCEDKGLIEVK